MTDQLVTQATVADHFRVSESTVRRWVRTGAIPFIRIGPRTIRFRLSEIEDARREGGHDNGKAGAK